MSVAAAGLHQAVLQLPAHTSFAKAFVHFTGKGLIVLGVAVIDMLGDGLCNIVYAVPSAPVDQFLNFVLYVRELRPIV
jgi:hypothetical protein